MKPIAPTPAVADLSDAEFSLQMARAVRALPDVPAALQRAAIGLFPARFSAAASATDTLKDLGKLAQGVLSHITAVLSFDSWATPVLAAGMRSLRSPTRHLLFSAEGRDIDLRISPQSPAADSYALAGQILGPDDSGSIELRRDEDAGEVLLATTLDALGEFRLDGIARGVYRLVLLSGSEQITLAPIEVGLAASEPAC